jgi:hypothetical protein
MAAVNRAGRPPSLIGRNGPNNVSIDLSLPADQKAFSELYLLALCNWREARNQTPAAKIAQACSVRNRVLRPGWWGRSYSGVITCHYKGIYQYTSFDPRDPNASKFPIDGDTTWPDCLQIAQGVQFGSSADTVSGATSYFDRSLDSNPPAWAAKMIHVCDVDAFHFFK